MWDVGRVSAQPFLHGEEAKAKAFGAQGNGHQIEAHSQYLSRVAVQSVGSLQRISSIFFLEEKKLSRPYV